MPPQDASLIEETVTDPHRPTAPNLRELSAEELWLLDYWNGRRRGTELPGRVDIDPLDFPQLLSSLALISVLRESRSDSDLPTDFRYRLAGTRIAAFAGRDPTGKRFTELYNGAYLTRAIATYREVVTRKDYALSRNVFVTGQGDEKIHYDRMLLPLASDGQTVDMICLLVSNLVLSGSNRQLMYL